MKILFINKFLHLNGGSETYIYQLGNHLKNIGHHVEYFGMEHGKRCMGNRMNVYTENMDFHSDSLMEKISYSFKTIYSREARKKIRFVLDDFDPDVCHLNNFNYQLTPSVILEIKKWMRETGKNCRIIFTAHDYQLLCPNHMFNDPNTHENCEKCLDGKFYHCLKNKCIHGSRAKSAIGMMEACFWKQMGVYAAIDTIICCSKFMKKMMDHNPVFEKKTIALHNFVREGMDTEDEKKDYVLYFGRFSEEKGIRTLVKACEKLPEIPFVFAGTGPLEPLVDTVPNIRNAGFQKGEAIETLIREARFSICPSEWYENCPFSVMESQMYGTPVLGAAIGGIPELIDAGSSGELFESGNGDELQRKIKELWTDREKLERYREGCQKIHFDTVSDYCEKLLKIYTRD